MAHMLLLWLVSLGLKEMVPEALSWDGTAYTKSRTMYVSTKSVKSTGSKCSEKSMDKVPSGNVSYGGPQFVCYKRPRLTYAPERDIDPVTGGRSKRCRGNWQTSR